jgi:uncharacterized membrane protein
MIALGTDTDGHERLAKRRRYRWGYAGSMLAGVLALVVAMRLGYPLVGIGLYWVGAAGMFAILWLSPLRLFDERERRIEQRASLCTLQVVGLAGIVAIPGAVALEEAGQLSITPAMEGAGTGFVALYVVFGVVYLAFRLRR